MPEHLRGTYCCQFGRGAAHRWRQQQQQDAAGGSAAPARTGAPPAGAGAAGGDRRAPPRDAEDDWLRGADPDAPPPRRDGGPQHPGQVYSDSLVSAYLPHARAALAPALLRLEPSTLSEALAFIERVKAAFEAGLPAADNALQEAEALPQVGRARAARAAGGQGAWRAHRPCTEAAARAAPMAHIAPRTCFNRPLVGRLSCSVPPLHATRRRLWSPRTSATACRCPTRCRRLSRRSWSAARSSSRSPRCAAAARRAAGRSRWGRAGGTSWWRCWRACGWASGGRATRARLLVAARVPVLRSAPGGGRLPPWGAGCGVPARRCAPTLAAIAPQMRRPDPNATASAGTRPAATAAWCSSCTRPPTPSSSSSSTPRRPARRRAPRRAPLNKTVAPGAARLWGRTLRCGCTQMMWSSWWRTAAAERAATEARPLRPRARPAPRPRAPAQPRGRSRHAGRAALAALRLPTSGERLRVPPAVLDGGVCGCWCDW